MDKGNGNASIVEAIPVADAPKLDAPHRILISFSTDHEINGMKVELVDVTPEQVAVACYHLMRSANQLTDVMMLGAARDRAEVERIRRELQGGKRS